MIDVSNIFYPSLTLPVCIGYGVHTSLKIAEEDRFYPTLTLPVCIGEGTGNLIFPQYIGGIKGGDTTSGLTQLAQAIADDTLAESPKIKR